jgi:hypothetical protein
MPVGLQPYFSLESESSPKTGKRVELLTGTVYRTLGFDFSAGHCCRIERRDED